MRRAVDEGVDVALEKQKKKQEALQATTVDMLAEEYFAKIEKGMSLKTGMRPHTFKQRKSIHERYISPLIDQPLLMIAGNKADGLYMTEDAFAKATGAKDKELFLIDGATPIETYWNPPYVNQAVEKLTHFYDKSL